MYLGNKKGMSLLSLLIATAILMTLVVLMLQYYQKSLAPVAGKGGPAAALQELRSVKQNIQKAAVQHGELDPNLYK